MTMSVALGVQIYNDMIEIRQLLNAPNYDVEIMLNGKVVNDTVSEGLFNILLKHDM